MGFAKYIKARDLVAAVGLAIVIFYQGCSKGTLPLDKSVFDTSDNLGVPTIAVSLSTTTSNVILGSTAVLSWTVDGSITSAQAQQFALYHNGQYVTDIAPLTNSPILDGATNWTPASNLPTGGGFQIRISLLNYIPSTGTPTAVADGWSRSFNIQTASSTPSPTASPSSSP